MTTFVAESITLYAITMNTDSTEGRGRRYYRYSTDLRSATAFASNAGPMGSEASVEAVSGYVFKDPTTGEVCGHVPESGLVDEIIEWDEHALELFEKGQYVASSSAAYDLRPRRAAATDAVNIPPNGSQTTSP